MLWLHQAKQSFFVARLQTEFMQQSKLLYKSREISILQELQYFNFGRKIASQYVP